MSTASTAANANKSEPGVFRSTIQTTDNWLNDITRDIGPDLQHAYHVLRAVLHVLRDQLTIDQTAHLSAQLPMLVRGIFFEQWKPSKQPGKIRSRDEFLQAIGDRLRNTAPVNFEIAAQAVFKAMNHYLDPNEVGKVKQALPEDIRALWPETNA